MSQKTALLVTTALTVFVMVLLSGIAWQVFSKTSLGTLALEATTAKQATADTSTVQPQVAQPAQAPVQAVDDSATQAQIAEREANYQRLIQQANAQLDQAYKQQQDLIKQIDEQRKREQAAAPVAVVAPPKYKVTAEQAASIALATVPGATLVKPAELVSFHDAPSFEVTLDKGVVYIDANTGAVIYNSAAPIFIRNSGGGGGGNAPSANPPPPSNNQNKGESDHHQEDSHDQHDQKEQEGKDH